MVVYHGRIRKKSSSKKKQIQDVKIFLEGVIMATLLGKTRD